MVFRNLKSCLLSFALMAGFPGLAGADPIQRLIGGHWSVGNASNLQCDTPVWFSYSQSDGLLTANRAGPVRLEAKDGAQSSTDYRVLKVRDQWIELQMVGEGPHDGAGVPVTWLLFFLDEQRFVWMRSDWPHGQTSQVRRLCPALMG